MPRPASVAQRGFSTPGFRLPWKPDPQGIAFQSTQVHAVLWGCRCKPIGHQCQAIWKFPLGGIGKNWAPGECISTFLEDTGELEQCGGIVPRPCPQTKFLGNSSVGPWMCAKPEACPQDEAPGQSSLLHRRTRGYASVCCLCSALGVVACPEPSLQLPWSCGTQDCKPLWPSEPSNLGMFLWDSCKTQALSLQTGVPDTEISPRGDTLEHRRGREKKHPPSEVSGEALRQPLDAV